MASVIFRALDVLVRTMGLVGLIIVFRYGLLVGTSPEHQEAFQHWVKELQAQVERNDD